MTSRLIVGRDVPWVTSWSQEALGPVQPCPTVDGALAVTQVWKPGEGRPLYSRNHLRRQRDSVRAMLCPMCGKPTQAGDRWSQTGRFSQAGDLRARGLGHLLPAEIEDARTIFEAGAIAPLHRACAERSLKQCPHLSAMPDRELKPFPEAWVVAPLYVEASGGGRSVAAVSFLQLIGIADP